MDKNRIDWIDIAKGFAILFVIIAHSVGGTANRYILVPYAIVLHIELCDISVFAKWRRVC